MIAADREAAKRVIQIWGSTADALAQDQSEFEQIFGLPATPFAMAIDEIGAIVAARPVFDRDDLEAFLDIARAAQPVPVGTA